MTIVWDATMLGMVGTTLIPFWFSFVEAKGLLWKILSRRTDTKTTDTVEIIKPFNRLSVEYDSKTLQKILLRRILLSSLGCSKTRWILEGKVITCITRCLLVRWELMSCLLTWSRQHQTSSHIWHRRRQSVKFQIFFIDYELDHNWSHSKAALVIAVATTTATWQNKIELN